MRGQTPAHDGGAEARLERVRVAEVPEPADHPDERLPCQVLGDRPVAGQQVRERLRRGHVAHVELGHAPFHHPDMLARCPG